MPEPQNNTFTCRAVVLWIDWYAYHLARFRGLQEAFGFEGEVVGIELVGGVGVHAGMRFREDRPANLPIRTLLPESSWSDASQLTLARLVWQQLNDLSPELVLVPGYYTLPALAAALWARVHGRTSVLMTESTAADHPRTGWREWFKGALMRQLFQWAVCGGEAHLQYLQQLGFPMDRVAQFYNVVGNDVIEQGVAYLRETETHTSYELPEKYFLYVGRLAPEKNVRSLWSAWLRYRAAGGRWGLVLAGDGPEMAGLKAAVEAADRASLSEAGCCQDVVFAGHRTAQQLLPYYAFASCFVLPSTREPWGLVVNEAMAAGLPVIASNRCGCAPTLVRSGVNGFIFDPASEDQLLAFMQQIASLGSAELEAMAQASRERIAEYSPRNFGREIKSIAIRMEQSSAGQVEPQKEGAR